MLRAFPMIADIYNKISRSGSNLSEALEDKITGDIFGTLRYLPAHKALLPFLEKAYFLHAANGPKFIGLNLINEPEVLFWPRYETKSGRQIEPDVELKCHNDNVRIFIEVKYKSGISGHDGVVGDPPPDESNNQLVKQMMLLSSSNEPSRSIVIYLTAEGAYPTDIIGYAHQLMKRHTIELYWLSWNELTSVLECLLSSDMTHQERIIITDLISYCIKKGFKQFSRIYRPSTTSSDWTFTNHCCMYNQTEKNYKFSEFQLSTPSKSSILISECQLDTKPYKTPQKWTYKNE